MHNSDTLAANVSVNDQPETTLHFRLPFGGFAPFAVMLAVIAVLAVNGMAGTRQFWVAAYAGIVAGLLLSRNRKEYCEAVVRGFANPNGAVIIVAWIFASILGAMVVSAGLVNGILWLGLSSGVTGGAFALATFVSAMLFSAGTGTANGTVLALTPVMYPAGVVLGADPTFLALALLSGAAFGDNVAPISDTTIVSAYSQGAKMRDVVRSRLPLALPAALVSGIALYFLGSRGGAEVATENAMFEQAAPDSLLLLVALAVVIFCALRNMHIIESLFFGTVTAAAIGIATGGLVFADIFHVPAQRGESTGLVQDAITGVVGAIVFVLLVMAAVQIFRESGLLDKLLALFQRAVAKTVTTTELTISGISILISSIVTSNGAAILLVGPTVVQRLGESAGLSPSRRANLMDCGVCSVFYMLPWSIAVLVWHSSVQTTAEAFNIEAPPITASLLGPYPWSLLLVLLFSILTGWNRRTVDQPVKAS
ncbi:MAG: Na+/H+ antiporter NhaC family protein, partial [Woeseia sp.]